jgi:uncharacterized protein YciW
MLRNWLWPTVVSLSSCPRAACAPCWSSRALTQRPVEGDKAAIEKLPAAGISTPAVVALSQLIAFVSYQLRVVAGLKAMRAAAAQ